MKSASARRAPRRVRPAPGSVQSPGLKTLALLLLCAVPGYGAVSVWLHAGRVVPAALYVAGSVLAFALYRHDKRAAGSGAWRIPEKWLHAAELAGGWPGALLAQQRYRHKTRKLPFQAMFWLIVLIHQAAWANWLWLGYWLAR